MTDEIDKILDREDRTGKGVVTNDPLDRGGRTQWGISERAHPDAWADGTVSRAEAHSIYEQRYLKATGFDQLTNAQLRDILVDFTVTSGQFLAVQALQRALKLEADGMFGPKTLEAANSHLEPRRLVNKVAIERIQMAGRVVKRDPSQLKWINGWLERFSSFID